MCTVKVMSNKIVINNSIIFGISSLGVKNLNFELDN